VGGQEKYVCDSDSLIKLHRHFERACVKGLRQLAKSGALYIPEGVARELRRRTGGLSKFIEQHEDFVVVRLKNNPRLPAEVARLETIYGESITVGKRRYPGFWASQAGRKAADSQVVAVAKVFDHTAVSDDNAVKLACALENVPCIGWTEFARRLGLVKQLSLFQ
jgi:hypothetical protein